MNSHDGERLTSENPAPGPPTLPLELTDEVYKFSILAAFPELESHRYLQLNVEGGVVDIFNNRTLHQVKAHDSNSGLLLEANHIQGRARANNALQIVLPKMIFQMITPESLAWFSKQLAAHPQELPSLRVEIPLLFDVEDRPDFKEWQKMGYHEHGKATQTLYRVDKWLREFANLPPTTKIYLSFKVFWRDLGALRRIFTEHHMHQRVAGCHFAPVLKGFLEYDFLVRETIAAVTDSVLPWEELSLERRTCLVNHGIRGIYARRREIPNAVTD